MSIVEENLLQGAPESEWAIGGAGDPNNLGFCREFSANVGETVHFSCHGTGTVLDIYRIGYYGGTGWHKVTTLSNTATTQPNPETIPNSNGGVACTNWSTTASWTVPEESTSGLYVGVYRNSAGNNASYIPFVIRDDSLVADIIIKTSDATWALSYNYYGTPASPFTGKSVYGSGGPMGDITTRAHAASYHRPIVTRQGISQTYWLNCEAPLIRFMERNGYNVKYVSSRDVHLNPSLLDNAKIIISSGHDEYYSDSMRGAFELARDKGKHLLFMSGNEVFWRTRFDETATTMWCYKDTMNGPGPHVGGVPLDPVSWTGTWKDTRWPNRKPENTLTGTDFRMNGVNDKSVTLLQSASFASHPVWRNSTIKSGDLSLTGVVGFEADRMAPTRPTENCRILAAQTININGAFANDNGQDYSGNGDLTWGIVSQRYPSGAVVVGFGTCQWAWALDAVHDRGGNYTNKGVQQFMVNLYKDLGASPGSLEAGLIESDAVSLSEYGALAGLASTKDGQELTPYILVNGELVALNYVPMIE